ncbi:MAG: SDR family NAD(P)-dependent oxidoreductase [Elusimicrobia bacterium]|nr:SDR family NAD(P)-dependent oxidoreductase [Elusimicrobiota bacterium]
MKDLAGRAVLVTGASSGIGWETALAFARQGCRVGLAARRAQRLEELARLIREAGGQAEAFPCDLGRPAEARAVVERAAEAFGRLDVLINNAGLLELGAFERQDMERFEALMRVNLLGAAYAVHAAIPHMRRRGEGHIVNVSSIAGLFGMPYMAAYCASKFALVGFTESLRRELYDSGIRLTAFCPGSVDTPMVADLLADPLLAKRVRAKSPRRIADKIVWSVRTGAPEVVIGEAPGFLLTLSRLFTRAADWATHHVARRVHPVARRERARRAGPTS